MPKTIKILLLRWREEDNTPSPSFTNILILFSLLSFDSYILAHHQKCHLLGVGKLVKIRFSPKPSFFSKTSLVRINIVQGIAISPTNGVWYFWAKYGIISISIFVEHKIYKKHHSLIHYARPACRPLTPIFRSYPKARGKLE